MVKVALPVLRHPTYFKVILFLYNQPSTSNALSKELTLKGFEIKQSSVYTHIINLEKKGWLTKNGRTAEVNKAKLYETFVKHLFSRYKKLKPIHRKIKVVKEDLKLFEKNQLIHLMIKLTFNLLHYEGEKALEADNTLEEIYDAIIDKFTPIIVAKLDMVEFNSLDFKEQEKPEHKETREVFMKYLSVCNVLKQSSVLNIEEDLSAAFKAEINKK